MSTASPPQNLADQLRLDAQNPWPGLAAFTEQQSSYFFGRDEEAAELFRCIKRERITVLFGKSGLGKTSLLQAGLFPQLRSAAFLPVYMRLNYADEAPSLDKQVLDALESAIGSANFAEVSTPQPGETSWEYLHRRGSNLINDDGGAVTPVLVLDQFEEWFTLGARKEFGPRLREDFAPNFTDLIENRTPRALSDKLAQDRDLARRYDLESPGCRILITLREDFLPNLENLRTAMPSLVFVDNRMRLTEMTGQQAFLVVADPSPDLVAGDVAEFIVRFVAGVHTDAIGASDASGVNPNLEHLEIAPAILSLFCRQLNEERLKRGLPGITRALVTAQGLTIIDDFYKQSIAHMHPAVRRLIEDRLLTRAGYRNNVDLAEARADLAEAGAKPSYIDELVHLRLLQVEEHRGVPRLELTHDVLAEPVRRSRDRWEEEQATAKKLEQDREALAQAKRAEQEALKKTRVLQKVIAAVGLVTILLASAVVYGLWEKGQAKAEAVRTDAAKQQAEANAAQFKQMSEQDKKHADLADSNALKAEQMRAEAVANAAIADTNRKAAQETQQKVEGVSSKFLNHCVDVSHKYYSAAGDVSSAESKASLLRLYEAFLMDDGQCFEEGKELHRVVPESVDEITDPLTMIPLRAANSAIQRGDKETAKKDCEKARELADSLEKENSGPKVEILVARTYAITAFLLVGINDDIASRDNQHAKATVAQVLLDRTPENFSYLDWHRISQVYQYVALYLRDSKRDNDVLESYQKSLDDEIKAQRLAPVSKHYQSEATDRAIAIGDYERKINNFGPAVEWYDKALTLARESGDRQDVTTINTDLRIALVAQNKYDEAHERLEKRIQSLQATPEDIRRNRDLAAAYADAAEVEEARKRWRQAVDYRAHAVSTLASLKSDAYDEKGLARSYLDLSWAEIFAGEASKGIEDANLGIAIARKIPDTETINYIYTYAIDALYRSKDYDLASKLSTEYIAELSNRTQGTDRDKALASAYSKAAEVEEAEDHWPQAIDYRSHVVQIRKSFKADAYSGAKKDLARSYLDLCWAEIYAGQVSNGIADARAGIAVAKEIPDLDTVHYVYRNSVQALTNNERYQEAGGLSDEYLKALEAEPKSTQRDRDLLSAYKSAADIHEGLKERQQAVDNRKREVAILLDLKARKAYEAVQNDLALAYGGLSWMEIEDGRFADGLEDAKKGVAEDSKQTWILVNEAHGLLLTGSESEAGDLYFKIKDSPSGKATLTTDIAADFRQLCSLGYVKPKMIEITQRLGINDAQLNQCLASALNTK